jgi:hypothetical protein
LVSREEKIISVKRGFSSKAISPGRSEVIRGVEICSSELESDFLKGKISWRRDILCIQEVVSLK